MQSSLVRLRYITVVSLHSPTYSAQATRFRHAITVLTPLPVHSGVEGEALLHMEELGNYTLKYLARRRTRKPPHDLVTGQTPDYMLSN